MTSPHEEGDPKSKLCFILEAPSGTELAMGRPVVGEAGQLFNEYLHEAGVIRASSYILNVFEERVFRPRGNGNIVLSTSGEVMWTRARGFTAAAEPQVKRFRKRIRESGANVFVPMGAIALTAMTDGLTTIMKYRGSPMTSKLVSGRTVIPTVHPAATLDRPGGQYLWRYFIIEDVKKAVRHLRNRTLKVPKRQFIIDPRLDDCISFIEECKKHSIVATDVEIFNGNISCFSLSFNPSSAISIPMIMEAGRSRWNEYDEMTIWKAFASLMRTKRIRKCNQNILFDMHMYLARNSIFLEGELCDPMIAFSIMFPDFPKRLEVISSLQTDEPYYKDDRKIWKRYWLDFEKFWIYNAKDSAVALECWLNLEPYLDDEGFRQTYDMTIDLLRPLLFMMIDGIKIDEKRLKEHGVEVRKRLDKLRQELDRTAEYEFNPFSPKQCIEYFYETKAYHPYTSIKTRKPSCDDTNLQKIIRRYNSKEARLVQQIRTTNKMLGYLDIPYDKDKKLRCSYNPRGTWTGRLSSETSLLETGTNMQNLPMEFKEFLTVDD